MSRPSLLKAVSSLPPSASLQVWQGSEIAQATEKILPSGFELLDAQLPGGGWPVGSLVEVLQSQPSQHVWQLILPALVQQQGPLVLVDAPYEPFGPSLQAAGLTLDRILRIQAGKSCAKLWATEQALRCADVAAVLAWLPQANATELRRLHMAAQQHGKLLFVFRPGQTRNAATPARLQLQLEDGLELRVRILKRRGPPLLESVVLPAQPARLSALLQARRNKSATVLAVNPGSRSHVLDRTEAHA